MAFNGSGLFVRVHNWVADKNNAINITSSEVDAEDDGFAAGLTLCVTRDGQGKMAADFLPNVDNSLNLGSASFRWASLTVGPGGITSGSITTTGISVSGGIVFQNMNIRANSSVVKATATNRVNNSVTNDPDLVIGLPSAGTYAFQLFLICPTGAGGISATMACTNVTSGGWYATGALAGAPMALTGVLALNGGGFSSGSAGANNVVEITGTVIVSAVAALSLQWAQQTTNAANTTVNAGSYLIITKLA